MNIRKLVALMIAGWILAGSPVIAADVQATTGAPEAVFENTTYEFSTVVDGATIVHDFILKNRGTADLKIEKVKTG